MRLFRRRARTRGRHASGQSTGFQPGTVNDASAYTHALDRRAAVRPVAAPGQAGHGAPIAPAPPLAPTTVEAVPAAHRRVLPPTGSVPPPGQVRLAFSDGSAVTLQPDDPRARAFRAVARELGRRD